MITYFDVKKPITMTCDVSQSGLGALLLQDSKPVVYASRALTNPETRYIQIETELLAIFLLSQGSSVCIWKADKSRIRS